MKKHNSPKPMGWSKSGSKTEVYSNTSLPQGTRKISNNQPKLTPKSTRERTNKTQLVERKKKIIKIRTEINEIETRKTIIKSMKENILFLFLKKIDKIDKLSARLTNKRREVIQINKIRNERRSNTIDNA